MSLKASDLKSNEEQKRCIEKEVSSILAYIDDELREMREKKQLQSKARHSAAITVPITFSIPYMSNADAQRCVYYKILISLIDRGFHVSIELEEDKSTFKITWFSEEELREIELQNALLAKHCMKKKDQKYEQR